MNQPIHHLLGRRDLLPGRDCRAVDHDHRQAKPTRRLDLGVGTRAASILGNDDLDPVSLHQRRIRFGAIGATRDDRLGLWQRQRPFRRIDEPKQIEMLWVRRKVGQMHAANRKHDPLARPAKCGDRPGGIRNPLPSIAGFFGPRRARKSDQRNVGLLAGHNRIPAHLCGEGVCRVDHMGDPMGLEMLNQPLDPAKTTHTLRQGLAHGPFNPSRKRNRSSNPGLRHPPREGRGFGRSAQYEEVRRHA